MTSSNVLPAVVIFLAALATACSGNANTANTNNTPVKDVAQNAQSKTEYPPEVIDEFLSSCEEAGSKRAFCQCVFEKVQARYTFEEFSIIESKISANRAPDDFIEFSGKARAECTK